MLSRFARIFLAVGLLVALWGLSMARRPDGRVWVHPLDTRPGPVRILRFYASVGTLTPGQTAQLCYSVENAKLVRISPMHSIRVSDAPHTGAQNRSSAVEVPW